MELKLVLKMNSVVPETEFELRIAMISMVQVLRKT